MERYDKEWEEAAKTGKPQTYWIYPDRIHEPEVRFVRSYTPALAAVVAKRWKGLNAGWDIESFP